MEKLNHDLIDTIRVWPAVSKVLSTIHSQEQFDYSVKILDELIDEVKENENSNIDSLIDTLGTLIEDYEDRNTPEPEGDPIGCLKYLMKEHNLKQSDLKEIGSQGVMSEILNGRRQLNLRQIKSLSKKFNVSPAVFI